MLSIKHNTLYFYDVEVIQMIDSDESRPDRVVFFISTDTYELYQLVTMIKNVRGKIISSYLMEV